MSFPREQLLEAFRADLREYLDGMRAALVKLERGRDAVTAAELDEVYRQAHGLRAAARVCDFATVEQIGKRLEQFFAAVRKGTVPPTHDVCAVVRGALDTIEDWSRAPSEAAPTDEPAHVIAALDRLLAAAPERPSSEDRAPNRRRRNRTT